MNSLTHLAHAVDEPGTAGGTPGLADGFGDTFTSQWIAVGELCLHAVTGGKGPPLLLLPGWPQTWYAWRLVMPALARDFSVVAADPRGSGLSDKPAQGYDTGTLANDAVKLMAALGHDRFAVIGHDVGMWTGYALAMDHPERVARLVLAEAVIPGLAPSPELFAPQSVIDRQWHFAFNRLADLNDRLVEGREHLFFGWQFEHKAATPLPAQAVDVYIDAITSSPEALHASFGPYRDLGKTIEQNSQRKTRRLTTPVMTIAGEHSTADLVAATIAPVAECLHAAHVLTGCGHFPAEEAPEDVLAALTEFLQPYRDD
jgi:pimeloyl-ACP methyl ester carboxylesterase